MWYAITSARPENYCKEIFKKTAIFTCPNNTIGTWADQLVSNTMVETLIKK
jgi:hypothetical protein